MRALLAVAALSGFLIGCDSEPEKLVQEYIPTLETPVEFALPAGADTFQITKEKVEGGWFHTELAYQHPEKWVIYVATTIWMPEGNKSFDQRRKLDREVGANLKQFIKRNNLQEQAEVVLLQYDPVDLRFDKEGVVKLPDIYARGELEPYFDAFVISPVDRLPGGQNIAFAEWIRPLIAYGHNHEQQRMFDDQDGIDDPGSKFWDEWNRHFIIVDPQGMVQDAYTNIGSRPNRAWEIHAMRSLGHHLGVDPKDASYPDIDLKNTYHVEYSVPWRPVFQ